MISILMIYVYPKTLPLLCRRTQRMSQNNVNTQQISLDQ